MSLLLGVCGSFFMFMASVSICHLCIMKAAHAPPSSPLSNHLHHCQSRFSQSKWNHIAGFEIFQVDRCVCKGVWVGDCISPSCPPNKVHTVYYVAQKTLQSLWEQPGICVSSPTISLLPSLNPQLDFSLLLLCPLISCQTPFPSVLNHPPILKSNCISSPKHSLSLGLNQSFSSSALLTFRVGQLLLQGLPWALQDVQQLPWPLPTRCLQLPSPHS